MDSTALTRFFAKVNCGVPDTDESPCWLWVASCFPNGYPRFQLVGSSLMGHRVSYEHFVGELPEVVHHECGNKSCVNPDHLRGMTHADHNRLHKRLCECGSCTRCRHRVRVAAWTAKRKAD